MAAHGAAKAGDWTANDDGTVSVAGQVLGPDEFELGLDPLEGVTAAALPGNDAVVVLDTDITPELEAEGQARDLVRLVQQLRKERELEVTDRIRLQLELPDDAAAALGPHLDWVAEQVLAVEVEVTSAPELGYDLAKTQNLG